MSSEKAAAVSSKEEASLLELLRTTLTDAFPNPRRIGCPDPGLRADLAVGRRDLRQHWDIFDHVCQCSPCFVEYVALRKQHRRRVHAIGATAVGALVIALAGVYGVSSNAPRADLLTSAELRRNIPPLPRPPAEAFRPPVVQARLDFSHWPLYRSDNAALSRPRPVPLSRGNLSVRIHLPLFSEPGRYRIILRRGLGTPLIDQSVRARMMNGDTVLENINVDTSNAALGIYRLVVRRERASAAREFVVRIR